MKIEKNYVVSITYEMTSQRTHTQNPRQKIWNNYLAFGRERSKIPPMKPQICLALDFEPEINLALAKKYKTLANFIKLGPQNIFEMGPSEIQKFRDMGFKVFLDCKFHDIPKTIGRVAKILKNVDVMTVHMAASKEGFLFAKEANPSLLLAGVAQLTSLSSDNWTKDLMFPADWAKQIRAKSIQENWAVDLFVMSGNEFLSEAPRKPCILPGIRLKSDPLQDDQKNVTFLEDLSQISNENILVIGRPLLQSNTYEELKQWQ